MQGTILTISFQDNTGIISGDDGNRYSFDASQWCTQTVPGSGQRVDFVAEGTTATKIYPIQNPFPMMPPPVTSDKSKLVAGLLAIFLGGFGAHKFYLGYNAAGVTLLVLYISGFIFSFLLIGFLWLWIPGLIALIEGIVYLTKSDYEFEQIYVVGDRPWF